MAAKKKVKAKTKVKVNKTTPEVTIIREALLRIGWVSSGIELLPAEGFRMTLQDRAGNYLLIDTDDQGAVIGASMFCSR